MKRVTQFTRPSRSLDYCAFHYLNQYLEQDRRFIGWLRRGTRTTRLDALKEAATFYRVARTLRTEESGLDTKARYGFLLRELESARNSGAYACTTTRILAIDCAARTHYENRSVISLITKMLWLYVKRPVILYDGNACLGLGLSKGDELALFTEKWRLEYRRRIPEIQKACSKLHKLHLYARTPKTIWGEEPVRYSADQIRLLAKKKWFQERVFDMYLWHYGSDIEDLKKRQAIS